MYRGGVTPSTASARQAAFIGWIGELLTPGVVLAQALAGHPNVAVIFRYNSRHSHVAFTRGSAPAGAQSTHDRPQSRTGSRLGRSHEGWTVQSFGAASRRRVRQLELAHAADRRDPSERGARAAGVGARNRTHAGTVARAREDRASSPTRPPRHADRAAEPRAGARPRRADARAGGPPAGHGGGRAVRRHRRLQARQRHPWARGRRPAAEGRRRTAAGRGERAGHRRSSQRRRVRGAGRVDAPTRRRSMCSPTA